MTSVVAFGSWGFTVAFALSYATGIIEISFSKARMMMYNDCTAQPVTKIMMERERTNTMDAATR